MNITNSKANYKGFGSSFNKGKLYLCASLKHEKEAQVEFCFPDGNVKKVNLEEEFFTGDVISVEFSGADFSDCKYRYICDGKIAMDSYSKGLSKDLEYSLVKKEKGPSDFDKDKNVFVPFSDSVIYITSVKGQTMLAGSVKKNNGTFMAFEKSVDSIKDLGATSILLMPVYTNGKLQNTGNDIRFSEKMASKPNFWGFGNAFHFALKEELAVSDAEYEFMHLVKTVHSKNMEMLLVMQYEKDCAKEYIIDSLIYYVTKFHIDGFRLIGENLPFEDIVKNPFLSKTKIISECFPDLSGSFKKAPLNKYIGVVSRDYCNNNRRFLKGDEDMVGPVSDGFKDNSLYYSYIRNITDFSGFSLMDLVSYNVKHNENNGENNTDGTDYNYSWNCGVEGETSKKNILMLRKKQLRNACLMTYLAQGTPLIKGGDEWLNTQLGNNNPYCQDNETGWIKYRKDKFAKDFNTFLCNLLRFRKEHAVLHQPKPLLFTDYISCKVPDASFHGKEAYKLDRSPVNRCFSILFSGEYARQYTKETEESVYIVFNMFWENEEVILPNISKKGKWKLLYCSDNFLNETFDNKKSIEMDGFEYTAPLRSVSVFTL